MNSPKSKREGKEVYLDYAAATPVDPQVLERFVEAAKEFANPSSIHSGGVAVKKILSEARRRVAELCGVRPTEIIFTSGATEANNIALQGAIAAAREKGIEHPHIISSSIEHDSTKEVLAELEKEGTDVSFLDPNADGIVEPDVLQAALRPETVLVAFSHVHSELGSVAPLADYARTIRAFRKKQEGVYPLLHVDASQSLTVFEARELAKHADMLAGDAAKVYGMRGAGVLVVREDAALEPVLFGGGQERGLRPGTENVAAIAAFAEALAKVQGDALEEGERLRELSDLFIQELTEALPSAETNSPKGEERAPHIVNVCFPGHDAEWLVIALDAQGVRVSRGSACKEGGPDISEAVFKTKGPTCAQSSLRFSFGHDTAETDIEATVLALKEILTKQRS